MDTSSRGEKRVLLKMTGVTVSLIVASLICLRLILVMTEPYFPYDHWSRHRMTEALDYVDHMESIPDSKKTILFLGSSDVEIGVNSKLIDKEFSRLDSDTLTLNLGFENLDPSLLHLLARRVASSMATQKRKIEIGVIKITPRRLTKQYAARRDPRNYSFRPSNLEYAIYNAPLLREDFIHDPNGVASVWIAQHFLKGIPPGLAGGYLWELIERLRPEKREADVVSQGVEQFCAFWDRGDLHREPAWNPQEQGYFFFGYPQMDVLKELQSLYGNESVRRAYMKIYFEQYVRWDGADVLDFDPGLVAEFMAAVRDVQKFAKHVVVLYTPEYMSLQRKPGALERLSSTLQQIGNETGAEILNFSSNKFPQVEFQQSDFIDEVHLNLDGQQKFARLISEKLSPLLKSKGGK